VNVPKSARELTSLRQESFKSSKTGVVEASVVVADPQNFETVSGDVQLAVVKTKRDDKSARVRRTEDMAFSWKIS
jgi:hypothetical protein